MYGDRVKMDGAFSAERSGKRLFKSERKVRVAGYFAVRRRAIFLGGIGAGA